MRLGRWIAIGAPLLAGVLVVVLTKPTSPIRANEGGFPSPTVEQPRGPEALLYETVGSSTTPARTPADAPRPKEWTARIRGRLVMKGTGEPPSGPVQIVGSTGNPEIDFAETVARLGGLEGLERLRSLPQAEAEAAYRAAGEAVPSLVATAGPDGAFEIPAPPDLPPFRLTVRADFVRDASERHWTRRTLDEAAKGDGIVIELEPAGRLAGTVRTPAGSSLARAHLRLRTETSATGFGVELDGSGAFIARGLKPGRFAARAGAEGFSPSDPVDVEIVAGQTATADFLLRPECFVSGTVVDDRGTPIERASVRLEGEHAEDATYGSPADSTRSEGEFRIGSLVPGKYKISAKAPQTLRPEGAEIEVPETGGVMGLRLVLPRGRFVAGRVLDAAGRPASGATLRVKLDEDAWRRERGRSGMPSVSQNATADSRGAFRVEGLEGGPFVLEASLEKSGYAEMRGVGPDSDGIEIALRPAASVSGRVLDAESGSPIRAFVTRSMRVVRHPSSLGGEPGNEERIESADGSFEIPGLKPGVHDLTFRADGYLETTVELLEVAEGARRDGIEVRMPRARNLSGWILESGSGAPVSRAAVQWTQRRAKGASPFSRDYESGRVDSGGDGSFEIRGLAPAPARLEVRKDGLSSTTETIDVGTAPTEGVRIELGRGGSIEGVVLEGGRTPREGARIRVDRAGSFGGEVPTTVTDGAGRFRIDGLASGGYDVRAVVGKKVILQTVAVASGQVTRVELAAKEGSCTVTGRILRGGEGVEGWKITALPERFSGDTSALPSSVSDPQGSFVLEGVAPGRTDLQVWTPGNRPRLRVFPLLVPEEPRLAFDIRLPLGVVEGRVVRAVDGSPMPGVEVGASPLDRERQRRWVGGKAETDGQGLYRIVDLEAATYGVVANLRDSEFAPSAVQTVEVAEGAPTRVDFVLSRGGSVAVTVLDPDGKPVPSAVLYLRAAGRTGSAGFQTDHRGVARAIGLAPGPWRARAEDKRFPASLEIEVAVEAEKEASCSIRLSRGVEVRLRVVGDAGPVAPESVTPRLLDPTGEETIVGESDARSLGLARADPGVVPLLAAPGSYKLRLFVEGYRMVDRAVVIGEASPQDLTVRLTAEERTR